MRQLETNHNHSVHTPDQYNTLILFFCLVFFWFFCWIWNYTAGDGITCAGQLCSILKTKNPKNPSKGSKGDSNRDLSFLPFQVLQSPREREQQREAAAFSSQFPHISENSQLLELQLVHFNASQSTLSSVEHCYDEPPPK